MTPPPPDGPPRQRRVSRSARRTFAAVLTAAVLTAGTACTDDSAPSGLEVTETVTVGPGTTAPPSPTTSTATTVPASPLLGLEAITIADDLREPVAVVPAPDGDRLWVVERGGRIVAVDPFARRESAAEHDVVLDLTDDVLSDGAEQGLLSIALHPAYPEHGGAFVYLVTAGDDHTELRHYEPDGDHPGRLDPASGRLILALDQPHEWHNGGTVLFGPDGYLYLSLGDGGHIGDRQGNGQNPDTLLGGVIRLDIDAAAPYAVPPDNPFLHGGGAPEVWVYGLRNPWRITTDRATGVMVIADVGHDQWEDIYLTPLSSGGGSNFGWPIVAGPECFQIPSERDSAPPPICDPEEFQAPAISLDRSFGCAVIGGHVYRGRAIPELAGHYVFGDYCRGVLRSFPLEDALADNDIDPAEHLDELGRVTSVGVDRRGELLVTTQDGALLRIVPRRA